jgi:hypothetical protein
MTVTDEKPKTEEDYLDDFESSYGQEAMAEAQAEAAARRASFTRVERFKMEKDETLIIRMLSPRERKGEADHLIPVIHVKQHGSVPTKPKPAAYKGKWPPKMPAVCRRSKAFQRRFNDTCWICDNVTEKDNKGRDRQHYAGDRYFALCVIREEVKENGEVVGTRNKMKEIDEFKDGKPTGKKIKVPDVRIMNMGYKNFFSKLVGMSNRRKTWVDRDLEITCQGEGTDTDYLVGPMDPTPDWDAKDLTQAFETYDLREPEIVKRDFPDLPDLRKLVAENVSDQYYNRFFIPQDSDSDPGADDDGPDAPSNDMDGESQSAAPAPADAEARKLLIKRAREMKANAAKKGDSAEEPAAEAEAAPY